MKTRNLLILAAVVALVAGYIYFYERHQLSTEEALDQANRIFPDLEQSAVESIAISNEHGVARLEKQGDGWRLVEPLSYPADDAAVSGLLGAVTGLDAERRLSADEVDASAYGLDAPEMALELTTGDNQSLVLKVGTSTALGSNRAVATDAPGVLLTESTFAVHLAKDPLEWRSKDVVEAFENDLASIDVEMVDTTIRAVRVQGAWRLIEPLEDAADRDHLQRLLSDLNALRVEEFIDDDTGLELGFEQPDYRVHLIRADGSAPTLLELGAPHPTDDRSLVACRRNGSELFWVRDTIHAPLAKAPVLWRSPKVVTFDSWDAARLSVTAGNASVTVSRTDGVWSQEDGSEADFTKINATLRALTDLEARSFDLTPPTTAELGRVELDIETGDEGGSESLSVVFHAPFEEGGRATATVSTRSTVMSVDPADLDDILVGTGAFAPEQAEVTEATEEESS